MAYITLSMILVALTVSCVSPQTGAVHYIKIGESVSPKTLKAKVGDEVRWVNLGREAVRLDIIGNIEAVVCQRGFGDLGTRIGSTRIASQDFVSLCLGKAGEVKFHVQREDEEPHPIEKRVITAPPGIDHQPEWMAKS
jgi:hypothetical protein